MIKIIRALLIMNLFIILVGCDTKNEEPITVNDVIYKPIEFQEYNSPAEENGHGGDKIQITGYIKDYIFIDSDENQLIMANMEDMEGNKWSIHLYTDKIFLLDRFKKYTDDREITICCEFTGFSEKLKTPCAAFEALVSTGQVMELYKEFINYDSVIESKDNEAAEEITEETVRSEEDIEDDTKENKAEVDEKLVYSKYMQLITAPGSPENDMNASSQEVQDFEDSCCEKIASEFGISADEVSIIAVKGISNDWPY